MINDLVLCIIRMAGETQHPYVRHVVIVSMNPWRTEYRYAKPVSYEEYVAAAKVAP